MKLLDQWLSWARRCRILAFVKLAAAITGHRPAINAHQRAVQRPLCGEIEELRAHRNNDLHQTSPRIAEALGREDREINMLSVWNLMQRELLRCTEALLTCFGCNLAHAGDAPSVAMVKV